MAEYVPTTDEVRGFYVAGRCEWEADDHRVAEDYFDRWLAAHDAQVKAAALREAGARMDDISQKIGFETPADAVWAMRQIVRSMADQIEVDT